MASQLRFADSSPQGGRDWFLSACYKVVTSDLSSLAAAMDQLQESAQSAGRVEHDESGELDASCYEVAAKRPLGRMGQACLCAMPSSFLALRKR